jgi:hypothetical protein
MVSKVCCIGLDSSPSRMKSDVAELLVFSIFSLPSEGGHMELGKNDGTSAFP